jgi:IclR family acetate operon transcriptional repressor
MDGKVSTGARPSEHSNSRPTVNSDKGSNAIEKVVAVVEALATESKVSQIARKTGLATSTVHRILQGLVEVGWSQETADRGYMLGTRLLTVTARADTTAFLAEAAMPFLRELRDLAACTVHLAVRQGDEAIYIAKLDGPKAYQMRSHVGLMVPLHCTAVGKAMLAAAPDDEVRAMAARTGLPARTAHTFTDADALCEQLRLVRACGYAIDEQENEGNIRCIGAKVIARHGVLAGVSVSSLTFDLNGREVGRVAKLVVAAANKISHALGNAT